MDEKFVELADAIQEAAIEAARARVTNQKQARPDDYEGDCTECGEEVPERRIALGFFNCVPCQERKERRGQRQLKE